MKKKIEQYRYISFDIFDTLVVRDVKENEDVFSIVEKRYNQENKENIKNFKENRKEAAQKAVLKWKEKEEVTIQDIYQELLQYYDEDCCKKLYQLEIETEINLCVPNTNYVELYKKCLKKKKKIILTSDMYLEEETIKKILNKCGIIRYEKLYLSSTYQKRKSRGTLYDYLLKDLKIDKKDLLHIGDNRISDFFIPRMKGISTILVKNKRKNMFYDKKVPKKEREKYLSLSKFISNHYHKEKSYYYNMGYETFGPILYGFSNWLKQEIKQDKIFFLSRDGYLISKAYHLLEQEEKSSYFYASRRALIIPTLWMDKDLKSMLSKLYIRDYIKIGNLFRKLGLEKEEYEKEVLKFGFTIQEELKYDELFTNKRFLELFSSLKEKIYENSKKEYELLLQYLKQENFTNDVCIVDIGWNGNMQMALDNIVKKQKNPVNIEGYYFGILPESRNIGKLNMHGYLFDDIKNKDIYLCLKVINSIFESMFLAPHGSVKTYKKEKNRIVPVLLDYEYKEGIEKKSYQEIQEGALAFIQDFKSSYLSYLLEMDAKLSFYNMNQFAYYPKLRDVNAFGDFKFLEDDIIYLAKPKKKSFYLFHPKVFFQDLYLSGWLIGFLKRLMKINLGFTKLYQFYIHIYLKKRKKKQGE